MILKQHLTVFHPTVSVEGGPSTMLPPWIIDAKFHIAAGSTYCGRHVPKLLPLGQSDEGMYVYDVAPSMSGSLRDIILESA